MPSAFTSSLRATTQPSLFERTTTGTPARRGSKSRSHDTENEFTSTRQMRRSARTMQVVQAVGDHAPHLQIIWRRRLESRCDQPEFRE